MHPTFHFVPVSNITTHCSPLTTRRSPLNVKHFYFCPQTAFWFQNEQKPLKIVQKQTWTATLFCPTAKFWLSNWKKIIFQLGNKNFPTGHFWLSSWIYTKIRFCKEFLWHADDTDSTDFWVMSNELWAVSGEYTNVILNSFQDLSAEKDKKRLAVRCWHLRLSESRAKLAWTVPSVSKLNKVKRVQHDRLLWAVI